MPPRPLWDTDRTVAVVLLYDLYRRHFEETYSEDSFGPPPLIESSEEEEAAENEETQGI